MMPGRILKTALALGLACTFGSQHAYADIYTWVDKSGTINVSNLAPPEGARVTNVMRDSPPRKSQAADAAGDSTSTDDQFLAERVRQLEQEVEVSKRQAPPLPPYPVAPYPVVQAPPPVQYPTVQYQIIEAPAMQSGGYNAAPAGYGWNAGCDPTAWGDCGSSFTPGFYPPTVVVVGTPGFRRPFPHHGGHRGPMQRMGRVQGGFQRR